MSDKLKKFVTEHRKEFDTGEPGTSTWDKIDAQLKAGKTSRISSKWLSGLKYLGFSLSILVIAIFILTKNVQPASSGKLAAARKDPATKSTPQTISTPAMPDNIIKETNYSSKKIQETIAPPRKKSSRELIPGHQKEVPVLSNVSPEEKKPEPEIPAGPIAPEAQPAVEKAASSAKSRKKAEVIAPAEPTELNSYTGTLYESSSLCEVLRAYKFPGKVNMYTGERQNQKKISLRTTSCSHLENMSNIKAVWLKGKTDKKITIPVKKRFKNIVLVKSDGREINPQAISHYYPGLGVISEYSGIYFNLVFNEKVEMILFFEDAGEGDKIIIDGALEAVVKKQP